MGSEDALFVGLCLGVWCVVVVMLIFEWWSGRNGPPGGHGGAA